MDYPLESPLGRGRGGFLDRIPTPNPSEEGSFIV